ncbi:MAG TPA: ricin-type beta-trefoil lectin domain protein [Pseudomonadales bacterium]|nr:ricin-type beta-trefoil lectin domain protein [Pseudomonadales bacterium]
MHFRFDLQFLIQTNKRTLLFSALLLCAQIYVPLAQAGYPPIAVNRTTVDFTSCADPRTGCPELRDDLPTNGSLPANTFYAPLIPASLLDTPPPSGQQINVPPAHNLGANEGRLRTDLRDAARTADPLGCSLKLSALSFATGNAELGRAYADLSVTGHNAFTRFRAAKPNNDFCTNLSLAQPTVAGCPKAPALPSNKFILVDGCKQALNRAYTVANYLRDGEPLRLPPVWTLHNALPTVAYQIEAKRKREERKALGWIAVSGEDDSPHRPVNVPASDFPQYDLQVDVPAPFAIPPYSPVVHMRTRYTVAQSMNALPARSAVAPYTLSADTIPSIPTDSDVIIFIHGMDSRAEEAEGITQSLFKEMAGKGHTRNLVVIAVDLPTSGFADNLDYLQVSPLGIIGSPKWSYLPVPLPIPSELLYTLPGLAGLPGIPLTPPGTPAIVIPPFAPIPDFGMTGQTPLLDFIENFIVQFVNTLDQQVPIKNHIVAAMGGSLGGNMAFRLGRRPNTPWLPNVIVWSPASIWNSMGEGADITKHIAVRSAWESANNRSTADPNDLSPARSGLRQAFFAGWDKPIIPGLIPAQSETWTSQYWPYRNSSVAGARLDRQETYDPRFLSWHWRLGAEQLLYSHQTIDSATSLPRFMSNRKPMLLACGTEDNVLWNEICNATQKTAAKMTATPGKAVFLAKTGHSLHDERPRFWAKQILEFLDLRSPIVGLAGKCMDLAGANTAKGTAVQLWDCHGGTNQQWRLTDFGLLIGMGNKCIDLAGGNLQSGTRAVIADCSGAPTQQWRRSGSNLVSVNGRCLEVAGNNSANGTPLQLMDCNGGIHQAWPFPTAAVAGQTFSQQLALRTSDGHFISVVNGGGLGGPNTGATAVPIHTDATRAGPWERFTVEPIDQAHFALKTANGRYLTAAQGGGVSGANDASSPIHTDANGSAAWERLTLSYDRFSNTVTLQTPAGYYLTAVNGGGMSGTSKDALHTDATQRGPWESFTFELAH